MQERFESSTIGRRVITWFVVFTLASLLVSNMPPSDLKQRLLLATRPYLNATGLDQNWGVYSPDPPSATREVQARLDYADGKTVTWHVPHGPPLLAPYRTYRWLKLSEYINPDGITELSRGLAEWLARTQQRDGQSPQRVTVVRRLRGLPPPGSQGPKPKWEEQVVYVLDRREPTSTGSNG